MENSIAYGFKFAGTLTELMPELDKIRVSYRKIHQTKMYQILFSYAVGAYELSDIGEDVDVTPFVMRLFEGRTKVFGGLEKTNGRANMLADILNAYRASAYVAGSMDDKLLVAFDNTARVAVEDLTNDRRWTPCGYADRTSQENENNRTQWENVLGEHGKLTDLLCFQLDDKTGLCEDAIIGCTEEDVIMTGSVEQTAKALVAHTASKLYSDLIPSKMSTNELLAVQAECQMDVCGDWGMTRIYDAAERLYMALRKKYVKADNL